MSEPPPQSMSEPPPPRPLAGSPSATTGGSPSATTGGSRLPCPEGWAILDRVVSVVGANELVSGVGFSADINSPPSALAISRALLLPDAESHRFAGYLHCVESTGHVLLCAAAGVGGERLVVCQAGTRKAITLPPVPAGMPLQLSMRDSVGIVDDPLCGRSGDGDDDYGFVVVQLHVEPPHASSATVPDSPPASAQSTPATTSPSPVVTPSPAPTSATPDSAPSAAAPTAHALVAPPPPAPTMAKPDSASYAPAPTAPTAASASSGAAPTSAPVPEATPSPAPSTATPTTASASSGAAPTSAPVPEATPSPAPSTATPTRASALSGAAPTTAPEPAPEAAPTPVPTAALSVVNLLCFASREMNWAVKEIAVASPCDLTSFHVDSVISHDGRVVFVDFTCGILACDPIVEEATFMLLPCRAEVEEASSANRCIGTSRGMLYYLMIVGVNDEAVFKIWYLPGDHSDSWIKACDDIPMTEIWNNNTYIDAGLPTGRVPTVGAIDPCNSSVVYLISDSKLFAVQLESRQTISWANCFVDVGVGKFKHKSSDICSWVIPTFTSDTKLPISTGLAPLSVLKKRGKYWTRQLGRRLMQSKDYIEAIPIAADLVTYTAGFVTTSSPVVPIAKVLAASATRVSQTLHLGELVSRHLPVTSALHQLNADTVVGNFDEADRAIDVWVSSGKPENMYIQFAAGISDADEELLRKHFKDRGAGCMLGYVDGWIDTYVSEDFLQS